MIFLLDFLTVICTSVLLLYSVSAIFKKKYNTFHLIAVVFYIIQIAPIAVGWFFDLDDFRQNMIYLYYAMKDDYVAIVYDIFSILTMLIFCIMGFTQKQKFRILFVDFRYIINTNVCKLLKIVCIVIMVLPLISVIVSPEPRVYLKFAYFIINRISAYDEIYIYHKTIVNTLCYLSFVGVLGYYYLSSKFEKIVSYFFVGALAWIDGKRTIITFMIIGLLFIDIIKKEKKTIIRVIIAALIVIIYFVIYGSKTGKSDEASFMLMYSCYFSRLCNVKLAIYSRLYDNHMLEYDGQSLLYNIIWWLPRRFWADKPYGFYNYYTAYAARGDGLRFIQGWNLMVNNWSEFIANFGILGYILCLIFIYTVVKISENSKTITIFALGIVFIIIYMMYGFENVVMMIFTGWLFLIFFSKLRKTKEGVDTFV